jgi:hypothetical protein
MSNEGRAPIGGKVCLSFAESQIKDAEFARLAAILAGAAHNLSPDELHNAIQLGGL